MEYPQLQLETQAGPHATLHTNYGDIEVVLFQQQAPKAVENFITHATSGYFNGVIFHRVIPDFMIQGGDPQGTGFGGESIWKKPFADEFTQDLFNLKGALSMANAGPGTNGSQFFIVQAGQLPDGFSEQLQQAGYPDEIVKAYDSMGGTPWLDQRHTVFGHVVSGLDHVDEIAHVATDSADKPLKDVVITSISVA